MTARPVGDWGLELTRFGGHPTLWGRSPSRRPRAEPESTRLSAGLRAETVRLARSPGQAIEGVVHDLEAAYPARLQATTAAA